MPFRFHSSNIGHFSSLLNFLMPFSVVFILIVTIFFRKLCPSNKRAETIRVNHIDCVKTQNTIIKFVKNLFNYDFLKRANTITNFINTPSTTKPFTKFNTVINIIIMYLAYVSCDS